MWLSKGEKEKNKGGRKGTSPLNLLEVTQTDKGKNNGCSPLGLNLCTQKQQSLIREQIPNI